MATTFATLKKERTTNLSKLANDTRKLANNEKESDTRYWSLDVDKSGNGWAIIRFLPASPGEDTPYVRYWEHAFNGPGGWYIERSLCSIGKEDPVMEMNSKLWNSGVDSKKDQARNQKRKLRYVSNIYIVKDPAHPENEGKVFLYRYGKKIFEMLNEKMNPQFPDEEQINPFDLWEGANFKLKQRKDDGWPSYDKSEFETKSQLLSSDEELEKVWNSQYKLSEINDEKNYKSYDVLKARLNKVLSLEPEENSVFSPEKSAPKVAKEPEKKVVSEPEPSKTAKDVLEASVDDVDSDLEYFKQMAEG